MSYSKRPERLYRVPRKNKYNIDTTARGVQRRTVDGHVFDSLLERDRYLVLRAFQQAGAISGLELQPTYELQPAYRRNGRTTRAITYTPDFSYRRAGQWVVEDAKGRNTQASRLRQKMFVYLYPDAHFYLVTRETIADENA